MTADDIEQIKKEIQSTIKVVVNGKIDKIDQKLEEYIKSDNEWKAAAQPVIDMGRNVQGFGRVSLYIVGFVAAVSGAILYILQLVKKK